MELRINPKEILIAFFFIILSRSISLAVIEDGILADIHIQLGRFAAICIFCTLLINYSKVLLKYKFQYILYFAACIGLSTLAEGGNMRRYIMMIYPILAMCAFIIINCSTVKSAKRFVHAIAWLFMILTTINIVLLLFFPQLFGDKYFMGLENQIGYPLIIGLLFVWLNSIFNGEINTARAYTVVFFTTIILIFSGSNIVGAMIIAAYLFFTPLKKYLQTHQLNLFAGIYAVVFSSVVLLASDAILKLPFIKFIIQEILGKSLTLTHRTHIWAVAIPKIKDKLLLGHGIGDTGDLFFIDLHFHNRPSVTGNYSAHNQLIQGLYETGLLGLSMIVLLFIIADRLLQTQSNARISGIFRICLFAVAVMYMAEAPGWNSFVFIAYFACVLSITLNSPKAQGELQNLSMN